jgi:hypothetical protein
MDINFDRASKFYEPGEKVTGTMYLSNASWAYKMSETKNMEVYAESYMDTVSVIRGNMGRPPLEEKDRIYFMKKKVEFEDVKAKSRERTFSFVLEATEKGEKLLDAYVGVEFSVIVSSNFV